MIKYRIGVLNDFKNSRAFMDYKYFSDQLHGLECCYTRSPHKGFDTADDEIVVFLNFKIVGRFKSRKDARACVDRLIAESPAKKDFESNSSVLFKDI